MNNEILEENNNNVMGLFAFYDRSASSYGNVFVHQNKKTALRYFAVEMSKIMQNGYPAEDYELWRVGFYDVLTGEIVPSLELLGNGGDYGEK